MVKILQSNSSKEMKAANDQVTNKKFRYDLLQPQQHILVAAFNGDLEQLKAGLGRIDLDKLLFSDVTDIAFINHHKDCVEYLMEQSAIQEAKEKARRQKEADEVPEAYKKQCPSCGPVETRYSNCPRCWGPVGRRR